MIGYTKFDKSINGVKVLTDGKLIIRNGDITNCDMFECNQMNVTHIDADNLDELIAVVDTNTNNINTINNTSIPNLQTQITTNTNVITDISNNKIPNLQSQITDISNNRIPNLQSQITDISNNRIPNLQSQITTNTNSINTLKSNVITSASVGTTTTLNSNQNATVSITKSSTSIGNNLSFDFGIPKGKPLTYRGNYNTSNTYVVNDIVKYNNNIYVCISDVVVVSNPNVSSNWSLMIDSDTITGQGFRWRGNWSNEKTFDAYDIALYMGSCYICLNNNILSNTEPDDDTTNWFLFVARGEKGDKGDKGDDGSDSDFASVLGILGGVGVIFGAVALTGLTFANQFQNMKNKLGNISDELEEIGEDANTDYRLSQLERKTKWQDADNTITNTYFNSDIIIRNELLENKITLYKTGEIDAVEVNGTGVNANDISTTNLTATNTTSTNLTINNDATITNNLTVNNDITCKGDFKLIEYITNTNTITMESLDGKITTKSLETINDIKLGGNLTYTEAGVSQTITKAELNQLNNTLALDSDVVKLTGDQTVAGVKTFSNNIVASGDIQLGGNITYTEAGVSQTITKAELNQLNNTLALDSDVVKLSGNQTIAGDKTFSNNILASGDIQLGGNITYTEAGISQTITKAELNQLNNTLALDNAVVKLSGNQTIAGNKTLTGTTTINTLASATLNIILSAVYPVGSIYINYNSTTNPSTLLGIGTWSQISSGTFLRANTSGGTTGGSTNHNHKWYEYTFGVNDKSIATATFSGAQSYNSSGSLIDVDPTASGKLTGDMFTSDTNHLPPYLNVIMWRRTA